MKQFDTEIQGPYPYQEEAITDILKVLKKHDRTHAVMACGTGKTRVCLWVAERLKAKRIAIFVPSLALINQGLHEWLEATSWTNVSCMAVCSDDTVAIGIDSLKIDPKECDFPVTTSSATVRRFLRKKATVKLIFCTYHSSAVLANAMKKNLPFDLCIFDEAHRTAGGEDKAFSIGLNDELIPAKKKLFVTATPRHYDVHHHDKEGEKTIVYSMDSKKHYGLRAHTLTFRKAINLGIISDYKVMIPVVIKNKAKISGDEIEEKIVGLQKAIQHHDISKIITFHSNISEAGKFSHYIIYTKQLKGFKCLHVNSMMSMSSRIQEMHKFRTSPRALITNARCLTEGTNVPAVDMVAFLNRKRSKIDIVQAIGRTLRKHPGKSIGYVFLPLFVKVPKGESIESAVRRTDYGSVWDVLQALAEQDEDLYQVIQYLRQERGSTGEFNEDKLGRFIEVLPDDTLDLDLQKKLRSSISVSVLDRLGSNWYEMYGRLTAFKAKYGHCDVPKGYSADKSLSGWVYTQRQAFKKNELSDIKIELLKKLEFSWNPIDDVWNKMYQKLCQFKNKHGHCDISGKYSIDKSLSVWAHYQRQTFKRNELSGRKIELLKKLEFSWNPHDDAWDKMYQKLCQFKDNHGHCDVPYAHSTDKSLFRWVNTQRQAFKKNELSDIKIELLKKLEFSWSPHDDAWNKMYQRLCQFKDKHGHCDVSGKYSIDKSLGAWVNNQRQTFKRNKLSGRKIELLKKLEFSWNPIDDAWNEMYQKLCQFKDKHGHCDVPVRYSFDKSLGEWVNNQRKAFKNKKLSQEKISLLDKIGFSGDPSKRKRKS